MEKNKTKLCFPQQGTEKKKQFSLVAGESGHRAKQQRKVGLGPPPRFNCKGGGGGGGPVAEIPKNRGCGSGGGCHRTVGEAVRKKKKKKHCTGNFFRPQNNEIGGLDFFERTKLFFLATGKNKKGGPRSFFSHQAAGDPQTTRVRGRGGWFGGEKKNTGGFGLE